MLVDATRPVPASLMTLLAGLAPLFTAPSFRMFCGLACGFLAQTGKRMVCGIGAGHARNRTARAVERVIPFQLACQAIAVTWYATAGHHPADAEDHRARASWYITKARPWTADMAAKLRRVLIAARFQASRPGQPTPEEINVIRLAWPGNTSRHNRESRGT